jgi:hypothetical protein
MEGPRTEDTAEKVLCCLRKVPLINDQMYRLCWAWVQRIGCGVSGRYLKFKTRYIKYGKLFIIITDQSQPNFQVL